MKVLRIMLNTNSNCILPSAILKKRVFDIHDIVISQFMIISRFLLIIFQEQEVVVEVTSQQEVPTHPTLTSSHRVMTSYFSTPSKSG